MSNGKIIDFWTRYSYLCLKAKVCPQKGVIKNLIGSELCCPVETIRKDHWQFLLSALSNDSSLTKVWFWSNRPLDEQKETLDKKKIRNNRYFPVPYACTEKNVEDICKCAVRLLNTSKALKILKIENLRLRNEDIQHLAEGLKNSNIEHLSLTGCELEDKSLKVLCRNLQSSTISWLDLSFCGISESGLIYINDLIKAHHLKRSNDMFPDTLRYRLPVLDAMKGIKRITLNGNEIGDKGIEILTDSLHEDIWMKALDLQKCGIGNEGARTLIKVLRSNARFQLIDVRRNNIDPTLVNRMSIQLTLNNVEKNNDYELVSLWEPPKIVRKTIKRKGVKTKAVKYLSPPKPKGNSSFDNLLKVAFQAVSTEKICAQTQDAYSQTFDDKWSEMESEKRKQLALKQLVKKYKLQNSELRKELEKRCMLDNYILIDHETYLEIKDTFEKFKRFLNIMKKYGLWECIEVLGVNERTDIELKPFVTDGTKKCIQIVEKDHLSSGMVDSASKHGHPKERHAVAGQVYDHPQQETFSGARDDYQEKIPSSTKHFQVNNCSREHSVLQAKVLQVFKDVCENYSKNPLSHRTSQASKYNRLHDEYLTTGCMKSIEAFKQLIRDKPGIQCRQQSPIHIVDNKQKSTNNIDTLYEAFSNVINNTTQKSVSASDKVDGKKNRLTKEMSVSSSASGISSYRPSIVHSRSVHGSIKSNEYKALPKSDPTVKSVSRKELSSNKPLLQRKNYHATASDMSDSVQAKVSSSDSEVTLKSSRMSVEKLSSDKDSRQTQSHSSKRSRAKKMEPAVAHGSSEKSKSSRTSISSHFIKSFRGGLENDSPTHESDTGKSYLESVSEASSDKDVKSLSVSDASTDKDVKSLSLSEVYSSSEKKEDLKIFNEVSESTKGNVGEFGDVLPEDSPRRIEENITQSGDSKSSRTKNPRSQALPKEKPLKSNRSDSSVPSLSDITTVSSRSLNTDSVMGQLSDD